MKIKIESAGAVRRIQASFTEATTHKSRYMSEPANSANGPFIVSMAYAVHVLYARMIQ